MKNATSKTLLLLLLCLLGYFPVSYAARSVQEHPVHQKLEKRKLSKKEKRAQRRKLRQLRKKYKHEMKDMTKLEKKSFLQKQIENSQFIPNPNFSLGISLLIIGGVLALIFGGLIGWIGGVLALIGLILLIFWVINDSNRNY